MKNVKYKELINIINDIKNYKNNQNVFLKVILEETIQIFCNDLRISIYLINFAKIIFFTLNKIPRTKENNEIINQYNKLIDVITQYFNEEKLEIFKKMIFEKKNKYIISCDEINKEEKKKLKNNINKILNNNNKNISDSEKKKEYIENNMEMSNTIKKYIIKEKSIHPENYISIENNINNPNNIFSKELKGNKDYILSLLGKSVENDGVEMNISKNSDKNFEKIELISIQSIFALSQQKNMNYILI